MRRRAYFLGADDALRAYRRFPSKLTKAAKNQRAPETGSITVGQFITAMEKIQEPKAWFAPYLALGILLGLRLQNFYRLEWWDHPLMSPEARHGVVDLDEAAIRIDGGSFKPKRGHEQPIPPLAMKLLMALHESRRSSLTPRVVHRDLSAHCGAKTHRSRARVEFNTNSQWNKVLRNHGHRATVGMRWHSTRNTITEWMIEAGISRELRRAYLGHELPRDGHGHYERYSLSVMRKQVTEPLSAWLCGQLAKRKRGFTGLTLTALATELATSPVREESA